MKMNERVIVVTPTHKRPNRLRMVKNLQSMLEVRSDVVWILVEDGENKDEDLTRLLPGFAVYLNIGPTKDFGNAQRNMAFEYIHDNDLKGVVYNADDDNWYDPSLFDEIKKTRRLSVFPVSNLGPTGLERPIVRQSEFVGWQAGWKERKFPVDMGGFAFRSELLKQLSRPFWDHEGRGGESEFISKFVESPHELEFLCDECKRLMVRHNELIKKGTKYSLLS